MSRILFDLVVGEFQQMAKAKDDRRDRFEVNLLYPKLRVSDAQFKIIENSNRPEKHQLNKYWFIRYHKFLIEEN